MSTEVIKRPQDDNYSLKLSENRVAIIRTWESMRWCYEVTDDIKLRWLVSLAHTIIDSLSLVMATFESLSKNKSWHYFIPSVSFNLFLLLFMSI